MIISPHGSECSHHGLPVRITPFGSHDRPSRRNPFAEIASALTYSRAGVIEALKRNWHPMS